MKTGLEKMVEWLENNKEDIEGGPAFDMIYGKVLRLLAEEKAQKPTTPASLVEGLCGTCNGSGMVHIAPNVRGMHTCPTCKGKGKMTGLRPAPSCEGLVEELREWLESLTRFDYVPHWVVKEGLEILSRHTGEQGKEGE